MTKVVFKFTIKRRLNCNYYYVNNILLILSWFNCLKNRYIQLANRFLTWCFFPRKIGRSFVATKATSHDRYCPLGTSWSARPMGAEVVPSSCWHRGSIFSLSASADIITDITLSPVSPRQASVRSSTGIFSVYRRAPWDGAYSASLLSREQAHPHNVPRNAPVNIRPCHCEC